MAVCGQTLENIAKRQDMIRRYHAVSDCYGFRIIKYSGPLEQVVFGSLPILISVGCEQVPILEQCVKFNAD